jgi:hypothetical protein
MSSKPHCFWVKTVSNLAFGNKVNSYRFCNIESGSERHLLAYFLKKACVDGECPYMSPNSSTAICMDLDARRAIQIPKDVSQSIMESSLRDYA